MTVTVTLTQGLGGDAPGTPIGLDDVDVTLLQSVFAFEFVTPFLTPEGTTILEVSNFTGVTAVLNGAFTFAPPVPERSVINAYLEEIATVPVVSATIEALDWVVEIDFGLDGPGVKEFVEDWAEADLVALSPLVNGGDAGPSGVERDGSGGDDVLRGTREDDSLDALPGDDRLIGRAGDDTLTGGSGDDTIQAGGGDDRSVGGGGDDRLVGGNGDDTQTGGAGTDYLADGSGDDRSVGGGGSDTLVGGSGDDTLIGSGGRDTFFDGRGDDLMIGGGQRDTFNFEVSRADGEDTIQGYDPAADQIVVEVESDSGFFFLSSEGTVLTGEVAREFVEDAGYTVTQTPVDVLIESPDEDRSLFVSFSDPIDEDAFWESYRIEVV